MSGFLFTKKKMDANYMYHHLNLTWCHFCPVITPNHRESTDLQIKACPAWYTKTWAEAVASSESPHSEFFKHREILGAARDVRESRLLRLWEKNKKCSSGVYFFPPMRTRVLSVESTSENISLEEDVKKGLARSENKGRMHTNSLLLRQCGVIDANIQHSS